MAKLAGTDAGLGKSRAKRQPRRQFLLRVCRFAVDAACKFIQKVYVRIAAVERQYVRLEFDNKFKRFD